MNKELKIAINNYQVINNPTASAPAWLGLMIGNSRLHWAWFEGETLKAAWDTEYLSKDSLQQLGSTLSTGNLPNQIFPSTLIDSCFVAQIPLYIASVVPSQTVLWQVYPHTKVITLQDLPLLGLYPTLGSDRALALLGAGETLKWPVLVIDAGTALTLTGANASRQLVGGAILPGLRVQFQSLAQKTAALPEVTLPEHLPERWAVNTIGSIQSGIIYTVIAGIKDFIQTWQQEFPDSKIVITGGDRQTIFSYLQANYPQIIVDPHLIFWGMRSIIRN